MSSEAEKNANELRLIRLNPSVMMDIKFSLYVLTPEFKEVFYQIPKKNCKECGVEYRVTHWCESQYTDVWIPNWESILRSKYSPTPQKTISTPSKISKPIVKKTMNTQSHPQPPKSKPMVIPATKAPQAIKQSSPPKQNQSASYKPKLSISTIAQLTQKERLVYQQLINWRNVQANREQIKPFMIAIDTSFMAIVYYRVSNTQELMQISGITPQTARKYGNDILRIMIRNGMATGIKTYQQQRKPTSV